MTPLSDQHTIETPEQMSLQLPVAGIGSRFLALAIDTLLQVGMGLALVLFMAVLGFATGGSPWVVGTFIAIGFVIFYGYFVIFEIAWNGQTPGKRAVGIRVIKESGRPLTTVETIGRNLMRIIDQLPGFYAVGVVVALTNRQNKRLGDFVAGSMLVRESALAEIKPLWHQPPAEASSALGTSEITVEDLKLIDTFLSRRYHLTPDVRSRMAEQILSRVRPKLGSGNLEEAPEAVLERIAHERRG